MRKPSAETQLRRLKYELKVRDKLLKVKHEQLTLVNQQFTILRAAGAACANLCFNFSHRTDTGLSETDRNTCKRACVEWDLLIHNGNVQP